MRIRSSHCSFAKYAFSNHRKHHLMSIKTLLQHMGVFVPNWRVFRLFSSQFAQFLGSWNRTDRGCHSELLLNGGRAWIIRTRWLDWLQLCWVPNQTAAEGKAHASSPQTLRTDRGKKNRGGKKTIEIQEKMNIMANTVTMVCFKIYPWKYANRAALCLGKIKKSWA